ncbi:Polysaccharide biosynthesis protein [Planctomycetes bacterium K23_9]|uniref:Polysaccharide biosynthesis protein n=2 Tax=Stieleria marina TaxID=1930275 RepID=A0A517NSP2_9BACT|nr:Polysaccharide biosynthesis protein [Planctomycetes bacterium K23_9]
MLGIFQAVSMICWAIATLGFGAAVRRFYRNGDGRTDELLIGRLWLIRLFVASIPISAVACLAWFFGAKFFTAMPITWVLMAILTGYLRAGTDVVESWYIIREEPVTYRTFTFFRFLSTTALVLGLVVLFDQGVYGAIIGELIGAAVWCFIAGYLALSPHKATSRVAEPEAASQSLQLIFRYSLPIIFHASFLWMLVTLDRLLLQRYVDNSALGVYEIAYMFASLLIVVATSINSAWLPDFFRTADDETGPKRFARTADLFFCCVIGCAISLSILSSDFIVILTGGRAEYAGAASLSRIILIGTLFQCFFMAFAQPLFFTGRTLTLACVSGLGVAVNVVFVLYLAPSMGTMGAAWATAAAYAVMFFAMIGIVHQTYRVPWNYFGILGASILFWVITITTPLGSQSSVAYAAVRCVCCLVLLGIVFAWFRWTRDSESEIAFFTAPETPGEIQ